MSTSSTLKIKIIGLAQAQGYRNAMTTELTRMDGKKSTVNK